MTENNARYNGKASFEEWRKEWALEDRYNFHTIEKKWQKIWDDEKAYKVEIDHDKEKFYALVEFPYPSGAGLHVGHPRSYTALDVIARKKRMQGFNVLYPMALTLSGCRPKTTPSKPACTRRFRRRPTSRPLPNN